MPSWPPENTEPEVPVWPVPGKTSTNANSAKPTRAERGPATSRASSHRPPRPGAGPFGIEIDGVLHLGTSPLWPVAISSQASVVLHTYRNQGRRNLLGSSSIFGLPDMDGDPITARAWTLDAFDDACERPTGILLWMDIEGGELDALQSGIRLLQSGRVHYINLEVRKRPPVAGWPTAQDLNSFLKSLGYAKACDYLHCGDHWDVIYLRAPVQP
jgi:hypothetical protein